MLLDDIIGLLGDEKASLTEALLKTKILLHQIGKRELADWVNHELNGYPDGTAIPEYRHLQSEVQASVSNGAWRASAHPIPIQHLDPKVREHYKIAKIGQPLSVVEDLASRKNGWLKRSIPMEANGLLSEGLDNEFQVETAWCQTPAHDLKGILSQVRSRLLDFLLELQSAVGQTATNSELREKTASVDAKSMFNHAIFGSNTTILISHNSTITATQTISGSELAEGVRKLVAQLEQLLPTPGFPSSVRENSQAVLAELREAATLPTPDVSRLRRGLESLKHVMEHATGHVVATGVLALIAELLSHSAH